ncbi:MAG TPA: serine/threonine protein kinase [Kofleriaceae bacterium]
MTSRTKHTGQQARPVRIARALASPIGVVITIPALVIAVGLVVMLVGRSATRSASDSMARHQLAEQAMAVQNDVVFALDQASPLMDRLRVLADPARPMDDVLVRLHDLMVGRPGIAFLSISFPDGTFRGAQLEPGGALAVQESSATRGDAHWFVVNAGALVPTRVEHTSYDPRTRGFYRLALQHRARVWTEPYTFFRSHETGITCAEPVLDATGVVVAVLTVDFDVGALSDFVARPVLDQARSIVFTRDGTVLAYPAGNELPVSDHLLRGKDLHDPALDALFDQTFGNAQSFAVLPTRDGAYLASIAPIGGKRAGVDVPLDWFVATVVPERTLLGPTHALEKSSVIASAGALAIAVGLALVLAWNLVRMRRQVVTARAEARTAEARARELGSYRLVAKLGTGGMGEVWRAEHRLLARSAAIKLIRAEAMHDPDSVPEIRERFRREAQTLASMRSRHTIAIFDYGVTAEGVFYYVMELLDGLDLESIVVRYGPQPAERVIQMMVQACASLAEAHDAGLLHRDIKPPNLFACRAADELDIVKLLDFGIVQSLNETANSLHASLELEGLPDTGKLTQLGAMLGTPGFMAPEQILGMTLDGRADLYALGCCAWWLLAGREVFSRDVGEAKLLHRHINEPLPKLGEHVRGWFPPELERVLASCLAKDVDDRPADARALAAQLRAIPIPADHAWTDERAIEWWKSYQPKPAESPLPSAEVQVIMPGSAAARGLAATGDHAFANTVLGAGDTTLPERPQRRR